MASIPSDPRIEFQDLVLINPPDHIYLVTAIWAVHRLENLPMPRHMRALSTGGTLEVARVGPQSLRVRFPDGFFPTAFSRYFRSHNDRFSAGQHFELPGLSVVVEALDAQGDPEQVLYEFPVPLEDPSLRWMIWRDRASFHGLHRPSVTPRRSPPSAGSGEMAMLLVLASRRFSGGSGMIT